MTAAIESDLARLDVTVDELASKGDFEALSAVLADDFVYSHSTGAVQDKQEWIDGLKPLVGKRDRVANVVGVEFHGDIAVIKGEVDIVWREAPTKYNRYVRVFRQAGGTWRAISQVTTPAPDRDPAKG
jgi:ketosteroid isomerase-like protein